MQYTQISNSFERAIRDDSGKYRVYKTPKGNHLPSITTVLKKTSPPSKKKCIDFWKSNEGEAAFHITELSKIYGTKTHKAIEDTLAGLKPDLRSEMVRQHFNQLLSFVENINNIYGIELPLFSELLKLAGTADCVAEYNGVLSIIDYKTKRKPQIESYLHEYFIQTTAYALMFGELSGLEVKQLVILVSDEKGGSQEFIKDPNDYKEELQNRIDTFYK